MDLVLQFKNSGFNVNLLHSSSWHRVTASCTYYLSTKKEGPKTLCVDIVTVSGEVRNANATIILVTVRGKCLSIRCAVALYNEWVSDHAVAGLEANLRLEGGSIERSIWRGTYGQ